MIVENFLCGFADCDFLDEDVTIEYNIVIMSMTLVMDWYIPTRRIINRGVERILAKGHTRGCVCFFIHTPSTESHIP